MIEKIIRGRAILAIIYGAFFLTLVLYAAISDWPTLFEDNLRLFINLFLFIGVYLSIIIAGVSLLHGKYGIGWLVNIAMLAVFIRLILQVKSAIDAVRGFSLLYFAPFGGVTDQFIFLIIPVIVTIMDCSVCILLNTCLPEHKKL